MKTGIAIAAAIAMALAVPAFAQDGSQSQPSQNPSDQQAGDSPTQTAVQPTPPPQHRMHRYHKYANGASAPASGHYNPAAMRLTGNEPGTAAYQASNSEKAYPPVDRAHVPGDPPVIDHSGDHATVNPTQTTIAVPPSN